MRVPSCRFKSCYPHQAQNKSREPRLVLCFSKDSWDLKRRRNEWTSSGRPERRPTKRRSARIKLRTVRSVLVYPKNRIYSASVLQVLFSGYFFRASLNALPALKAGTVEAGMLIVAPVAGLCPVRADLLRDSNVPKPVNRTESPFTTVSVIAASSELITAAVSFFGYACACGNRINNFFFWLFSVISFLELLYCLTD